MSFFSTSRANIHYDWKYSNRKTSLIFINALGTDFRIWDRVSQNLEKQANLLLFDKQGHGLSSLNPQTNSLDDYLSDLIALLDHLKIEQCHVVGLSVGGMIAQLMACVNPNRIDKLILCDTRHKIGEAAGWNSRIQQVRDGGVAAVADAVLQRWFSASFAMANPNVVAGIRTMLERCNTMGYVQTCQAIRDADFTEKSKSIQHKTLCVVGSEDKSTLPNDVRDLHDLIHGSRFEIIQGSGHLPCVDNPETLSSLISGFINNK